MFKIIRPNEETFKVFIQLIKKYKLKDPRQFFDIYLCATMLSHKVDTILTANAKDFSQISEIKIIPL